jgi:hypothetical protein
LNGNITLHQEQIEQQGGIKYMEEGNESYNKTFKSIPEIETKIKDLNKELKSEEKDVNTLLK